MDTLDFLVRYWELRARYETLGVPLNDNEQLELLSLLQLVASDVITSEIDPQSQTRRGVPVQLTAGTGFLSGDLRELMADGVVVGAAEPIAPGARTIVYLADA